MSNKEEKITIETSELYDVFNKFNNENELYFVEGSALDGTPIGHKIIEFNYDTKEKKVVCRFVRDSKNGTILNSDTYKILRKISTKGSDKEVIVKRKETEDPQKFIKALNVWLECYGERDVQNGFFYKKVEMFGKEFILKLNFTHSANAIVEAMQKTKKSKKTNDFIIQEIDRNNRTLIDIKTEDLSIEMLTGICNYLLTQNPNKPTKIGYIK